MFSFIHGYFSWSEYAAHYANLSPDRIRCIERLIIQGILLHPANIPPWFSVQYIPEPLYWLATETCYVLHGYTHSLLQEIPPPQTEEERIFWEERAFLHYLAALEDNSSSTLQRQEQNALILRQSQNPNIQEKVKLQYVISSIQKGFFTEALEKITQPSKVSDILTAARLFDALSLLYIHTGQFTKAQNILNEERTLWSSLNAPALILSNSRRKALLMYCQEKIRESIEICKNSIFHAQNWVIENILIREIKAYAHLRSNEILEAKEELKSIQNISQKNNIKKHEKIIENLYIDIAIKENKTHDLFSFLEKKFNDINPNQNPWEYSKILQHLSKAYCQKNHWQQALEYAEKAFIHAQLHAYTLVQIDMAFLCVGIHSNLHNINQARNYLNIAARLSRNNNLKIREYCITYLSAKLSHERKSLRPLFRLCEDCSMGGEIENYLSSVGIILNQLFLIKSHNKTWIIKEEELRHLMLQTPGVFWFPEEKTLVVYQTKSKNKLRVIYFPEDSRMGIIFDTFIQNPQGISLEKIHQLKNSTEEYHPLQHSAQYRMQISRIRAALEKTDVEIIFERSQELYKLVTPHPLFTVTQYEETSSSFQPHANREEQILAFIATTGRKTTQELVKEFNVTRQALHPLLKNLVQKKLINLVRKGPISYYEITSDGLSYRKALRGADVDINPKLPAK